MWNSTLPTGRIRDVLARQRRTFQPQAGERYRLLGVRLYGEGCHVHDEVAGELLQAPSLTRVEAGDVVYNKMWASKGSFAVVGDAEDGASATSEYPAFRTTNGADTRYLCHVLQQPRFWRLAKAWSSGSTSRTRLNPRDFLTLPLPLPEAGEQARIGVVLDTVDCAIAASRAYLDQLSRAKHVVMRELLTVGHPAHRRKLVPLPEPWRIGRVAPDIGRMPAHWRLVTLTKFARLESGHTPSRKHPEYWGGDIPWLSLGDTSEMKKLRIETTAEAVTQAGIDNSSARLLPADTVVLSRTAVRGLCSRLGRPMATSQDFVAFISMPDLRSGYLMQVFRHMQREWKRLEQGSSPTNKTLYFAVFNRLKVLLPPEEEQESIAAVGEGFDERILAEQHYLQQLRESKRGLAQALLSGRVRVTAAGEMGRTRAHTAGGA